MWSHALAYRSLLTTALVLTAACSGGHGAPISQEAAVPNSHDIPETAADVLYDMEASTGLKLRGHFSEVDLFSGHHYYVASFVALDSRKFAAVNQVTDQSTSLHFVYLDRLAHPRSKRLSKGRLRFASRIRSDTNSWIVAVDHKTGRVWLENHYKE